MARQPNKRDPYTGAAEAAGGNLDALSLIQSVLGMQAGGPALGAESFARPHEGDDLPDTQPEQKDKPAGANYSYLAQPQQTVAEGIKSNLDVDARNKMQVEDRLTADRDKFFDRNRSALGDPNAPHDAVARANTIRTMQGLGLNPVDHSGGVNMGPDRELPQMGARERQRTEVNHADRSPSGVPMPKAGQVRAGENEASMRLVADDEDYGNPNYVGLGTPSKVPMAPSALARNPAPQESRAPNDVNVGQPPPLPRQLTPVGTPPPAPRPSATPHTVTARPAGVQMPQGGDMLDNAHIVAFFKKLLSGGYQHPGP